MGTNTMQIASVDTNAGTAICCAPSRIACSTSFPMARLRLMFSISTVASSTRMPTASANPPRVMMLMVSPNALSTMMEVRIESGMETAIITVLRQLPRNSRIISPVRQAAMIASRPHRRSRPAQRWIGRQGDESVAQAEVARIICGSIALIPEITSRVEALPAF